MENLEQKTESNNKIKHKTKIKKENHNINSNDIFSSKSSIKFNISNDNGSLSENNKNLIRETIKYTKNSKSFEKIDLITRLSLKVEYQDITKTEKTRIKNLFKNFVNYLNDNKSKNKRKMTTLSKNIILAKRIKIIDINKFIDAKYKHSTNLTIHNMKNIIRKYARLLNIEPKLNFQKKYSKIIHKKYLKYNKSKDINIIIKYIARKSNLLNILLFYFLVFLLV